MQVKDGQNMSDKKARKLCSEDSAPFQAWSDMYTAYFDSWSESYEFYSTGWSELYSLDMEIWSEFFGGNFDVDAIVEQLQNSEEE